MSPDLRRCAGKFIYARGGAELLHFMPLHDFHMESALDISVIIALRSSRMAGAEIGDLELSRWMDISGIAALTRIAGSVLNAIEDAERPVRICELHAGLGALYESLRWTMSRQGRTKRLAYRAFGPAVMHKRVELLHAGEAEFGFASEGEFDPNEADLAIFNHPEAVRHGQHTTEEDLARVANARAAIFSLRVCDGATPVTRLAVSGREVTLFALDRIIDTCRKMGPHWRCRYVAGHDQGYFLPASGPATGLLLAYSAGRPLELPQFTAP